MSAGRMLVNGRYFIFNLNSVEFSPFDHYSHFRMHVNKVRNVVPKNRQGRFINSYFFLSVTEWNINDAVLNFFH